VLRLLHWRHRYANSTCFHTDRSVLKPC
jgi:hypothetical protein